MTDSILKLIETTGALGALAVCLVLGTMWAVYSWTNKTGSFIGTHAAALISTFQELAKSVQRLADQQAHQMTVSEKHATLAFANHSALLKGQEVIVDTLGDTQAVLEDTRKAQIGQGETLDAMHEIVKLIPQAITRTVPSARKK